MPSKAPFALSSFRCDKPAPVDRSCIWEGLYKAIDSLPERLALVVTLRYFGDDGKPLKLAQIGQRLGITDERVRQLLKKALAQLRNLCEELLQVNTD